VQQTVCAVSITRWPWSTLLPLPLLLLPLLPLLLLLQGGSQGSSW
jgi:hypothetical protein